MLRIKVKEFLRQLPAGRRALALVWAAAGWWTVAWGVLLVGQGLLPAGQALLLRTLVNRLVVPRGWATIAPPALGIACLWIVGQLLSSALSWVREVQAERVQDEVHRLIHVQALRLDLAFYDHPESYDQLHRARVDAISQPLALLESLGFPGPERVGFSGAGRHPVDLRRMVAPAPGVHRNSRPGSGRPTHPEGTPLAPGAYQRGAENSVSGLADY